MVKFKKILCLFALLLICSVNALTVFAENEQAQTTSEEVAVSQKPKIIYSSQVQDKGWLKEAVDGEVSGTQSEARRLETIWIRLDDVSGDGGVTYRSLVQDQGWTDWVENGAFSGSIGQEKTIHALEIKLTGALAEEYDVYYRTFIENYGWQDYAKNGTVAGAVDLPLRMEAVQIVLAAKGAEAPGATASPARSLYEYRVDPSDGQTYLYDFDGSRVNGWFTWNKVRYYGENGILATGWKYLDGFKFYFDEQNRLIEDVDAIIGKQNSYEIMINKQMNCLTIYAQDGANGYIIPVKAMLCTTGDATPLGVYRSPEKYRWRLMVNDSYSQYATRIVQSFLIHSVGFWELDNRTLMTAAYNNLGIYKSLGCVRVTTGNAKWIYDNCKIGTKITIYNSDNIGPFTKPAVVPIPDTQTWDPTDPNI